MEDCVNKDCKHHEPDMRLNCSHQFRAEIKECKNRLIAKTDGGATVPCSDGLSDVLELLEKDLKLSQRLIDDNKVKNDVEMVRTFQIKRGHTRDLIEQIKALGR